MTAEVLEPRLELISEEYVLVQAWKKTASYVRYHNWYSDTLELDRAAVNLPGFLGALAERLRAPGQWKNDPLRIVLAPKSQQWRVAKESGTWEPVNERKTAKKLRPLAYVSLTDQVAATAVMLCLADRVETIQGDPRTPIGDERARKAVVSYGNRLFCDGAAGGQLRHRWGSGKLYRSYFVDYRKFLSRPEIAAEQAGNHKNRRIVIVHSDLDRFYDRVLPVLLARKIDGLKRPGDDGQFYSLTHRILNWEWNAEDSDEVQAYAKQAGLKNFSTIALPQGLVASGFFANVSLLDFDHALRRTFSHRINSRIRIVDICRYVDDMRLVLEADSQISLEDVEAIVTEWVQGLLDKHAEELRVSEDKTRAAEFRGDERPLVLQSRKMEGIQGAISGGFDAIGGEKVLNAVHGLLRSQERYSEGGTEERGWAFAPIPDVRDETVARFAAARFRSTFRSLRPLLSEIGERGSERGKYADSGRSPRTQADLDDEAKTFALGLVENWINDPSNVRLLRIGLDLWPAKDVLNSVLKLLRPFTTRAKRSKASRLVAWYCLAEIFRAGATETGLVEDDELLPKGINPVHYQGALRREAFRLLKYPSTVPWYVKQQVLLFLAVGNLTQADGLRAKNSGETQHYGEMVRFLKGDQDGLTNSEFATLAILSRRAFRGRETAVKLVRRQLDADRLNQIAKKDPSFALEIIESKPRLSEKLPCTVLNDLCVRPTSAPAGWVTLSDIVLGRKPVIALRNELTLLKFAAKFLMVLAQEKYKQSIAPPQVLLRVTDPSGTAPEIAEVRIVRDEVGAEGSMYSAPRWAPAEQRWRFQLGFLLRFILSAHQDFTHIVRHQPQWRESVQSYRPARSHWYQCLYGLYSGHSAFGDDWLAVSDWTEQLLLDLLRWPGCRTSRMVKRGPGGIQGAEIRIKRRLKELSRQQGESKSVLILPLRIPRRVTSAEVQPLRACIVQTVVPSPKDFVRSDLSLSKSLVRRRHRNHLSTALAAVEQMLALRETHLKRDGRLDWLILPELSVHPRDVKTHLVTFARKYKTIILAGLAYQELFSGSPLVNSAVWIIPSWSEAHGWQILTRLQGKHHLAPEEQRFNTKKKKLLRGFRPCQWLVAYDWSGVTDKQPLWLTASVCYDATDLSLVSDLRDSSDVFAIPSLNQDVRTFDQMALALHYHMFQLVIVANNGIFGGSNAYAPYQRAHVQQVFHLHGQPQASIAFLEIDDIGKFLDRRERAKRSRRPTLADLQARMEWKFPPAGV